MSSRVLFLFQPSCVFWVLTVTMFFGSIWTHRTDPSQMPVGSMLSGRCRLLFNEINLYPNSQRQFIELKKICERPPDRNIGLTALEKYKLLFIDNDGYMVAVCHLELEDSRGRRDFFVIGGTLVNERNMAISKCHLAEDSAETADQRFPTGSASPVGILLLYNQKLSVLENIDLDSIGNGENIRYKKVKIPSGGKIMANLQDMIIATSYSPYTKCKYFDKFYNGFTAGEICVLRDYGQTVQNDIGLSRCPKTESGIRQFQPFQMWMFAYSKRTPGQDNDCQNAASFNIEDTQPLRKRPKIDFTATPGHECYITTEDPFIESNNMISNPLTYAEKLQSALREASLCSAETPNSPPAPTVAVATSDSQSSEESDSDEEKFVEGTFLVSIVPSLGFEEDIASQRLHNWQDCTDFQPESLISKLKRPGKQPLDWEDVMHPQTCNWFEFLGWVKPTSGKKAPKFRCKICNRLLRQGVLIDRPRSKWITKIMTTGQGETGKCARTGNRRLLRDHRKNPLHKIAQLYIKLLEEGFRGTELFEKFKEKGSEYYEFLEATANLFSATYQAVRLDITFFKFNVLRELLINYGVKIGHLYANPGGMKLITMSISDSMHNEYVTYLKENRPVFSILVDLSTDVAALPAAAFVFQTLDSKGKLATSLYRVLHLTGETSQEIYDSFLDQIKLDGLEAYLQEKLVGYASDSGSNVLKFREMLQQFVDHDFIKNTCQAHRLENAHKAAWKTECQLLHVDHIVNDVHRIFHRSAKKKRVLVLQQRILGDSAFDVKRYHQIRWVASKKRALGSLLSHWKTILTALEEISNDKTFVRDQRDDAKDTATELKDPTFISTLAFATDVFEVMSPISLDLQYRGTTLIGKRYTREKVLHKLQEMKRKNGKHLNQVLSAAVPTDAEGSTHAPTLEEFETKDVVFQGIPLIRRPVNTPCGPSSPETLPTPQNNLFMKRDDYIDKLIAEIRKRFPVDPLDDFDIFDAYLWPKNTVDLNLYGNTRMASMNEKMLWNFQSTTLLPEWRTLKITISQHPEFKERQNNFPENFWSFYLSPESGIDWPESLKIIITNIVAAPASSAEVERIFSFYTSTKTVKRYQLDVSTVDAIIRLKFNGPKNIRDFKVFDYLPNFLKHHARADDEVIRAKRTKNARKDNQDLEDSEAAENEDTGNIFETENELL